MKKIIMPLFFLFLISFVSEQVFSQKIKHVILIGSDGFGAYAFEKAKIPNLRAMMKEGSWSLQARTVLPSSSAANWASMVMGAGPELHGYTTWGSKKPDMPPRVVDDYGMFPSLYSQLRKEKPDSEIGVIYEWDGIGYLFPKAAVNKDQNADGDIAVTKAASDYIKEKKPNFLFVHLHDVDSVGHKIGHGTPEYYSAIERTDAHIGTILKSIEDAGIAESTVVLFTADHGGINKGHGLISMNEMQIPWIIKGPGIIKDQELLQSIMTFDTAATIAELLKLKAPQVWIGRPVKNAMKKFKR
ncbi:Type I phosphodiesterase / nucleotide pyrophosphatase [Daejeonella rubra]|uniref:Type I phosphodiesterase / nucleotide pyrophosphatase n=1 Tax=Daejeonella rubra TaxID=990371 RepID=A0A1G9V8U6_9SPHI|nr:alkaline phosphatase [Daejeonella rubra]SDM68589.1 Type I phosphodiesterase / nucleotide pyrophosphatase [Daejeonella rubra]